MRFLQSGAIFFRKGIRIIKYSCIVRKHPLGNFYNSEICSKKWRLEPIKEYGDAIYLHTRRRVFNGVIIAKISLLPIKRLAFGPIVFNVLTLSFNHSDNFKHSKPTDWMAQTFFGVAKNAANVTCVAKTPFCRRSRRQVLLPKERRTCTPLRISGNCLKASSLVRTL
ncbi:hypothetical protein CEXT_789301 [Caerostris extrusa]|uniref:Uncharacterized protein n=1 Tax=Caerostris extrusa TaxID=172846 RepID=A0AAV4VXI4_CAEEX|nr:hypothetical protein CEXT_789301 [Caerostris extrusa]